MAFVGLIFAKSELESGRKPFQLGVFRMAGVSIAPMQKPRSVADSLNGGCRIFVPVRAHLADLMEQVAGQIASETIAEEWRGDDENILEGQ